MVIIGGTVNGVSLIIDAWYGAAAIQFGICALNLNFLRLKMNVIIRKQIQKDYEATFIGEGQPDKKDTDDKGG